VSLLALLLDETPRETTTALSHGGGGGSTRPLPRDEGLEELFSAPTYRRLNVVVRFLSLYPRGGPKWRDNYPEGPDRLVALNRLALSHSSYDHQYFVPK